MEIVFYDLETTIPASHILEFGCVVVDAETFEEVESFETLVYSGRITSASMAANGITPEMVEGAPRIDEVIDVIYAYLHGRIWAGHNIRSFDNPIIRRTFESFFMGAAEPADVIDTLPLSRKYLSGKVKNHKLATLAEHYDLGEEDHRGLSDARMSLGVYQRIRSEQLGIPTLQISPVCVGDQAVEASLFLQKAGEYHSPAVIPLQAGQEYSLYLSSTHGGVEYEHTISGRVDWEGTQFKSVTFTPRTYRDGVGYSAVNGQMTVVDIVSGEAHVAIPEVVHGQPVTAIESIESSTIERLTIPRSVTMIEESAFACCTSLRMIVVDESNPAYASHDGVLFDRNKTRLIQYAQSHRQEHYIVPETVTSIDGWSFYDGERLRSVTFPSSLTSIGPLGFFHCDALKSITIPSNVHSIGESAFCHCSSLMSVTIPESVRSIGNGVFRGCQHLCDVELPAHTRIGKDAFKDCEWSPPPDQPKPSTESEFALRRIFRQHV